MRILKSIAKHNHLKLIFAGIIVVISINFVHAQSGYGDVTVTGAMKNVMWKGQLNATIKLDTLKSKEHLYGLGPLENLKGELMIIDGRCFQSRVVDDSLMQVNESFNAGAPFFGYASVFNWKEVELPDTVKTISQLELFLDAVTKNAKRPFLFKMSGKVDEALIHVVNLPDGTQVKSPNDAHAGQKNFNVQNQDVYIIGFFSKEHQAIFTHHDTYLHLHLITSDYSKMGHVDKLTFDKSRLKLFLPVD